jgi:hypothetical protein
MTTQEETVDVIETETEVATEKEIVEERPWWKTKKKR